jgi:hypothetical protein
MLGVGYLLSMNQRDESTIVEVDGKSLRLTHLSKVIFPDDGFTKAELLLYYQTIAPLLLPHPHRLNCCWVLLSGLRPEFERIRGTLKREHQRRPSMRGC